MISLRLNEPKKSSLDQRNFMEEHLLIYNGKLSRKQKEKREEFYWTDTNNGRSA